jgi:hypothetical protein
VTFDARLMYWLLADFLFCRYGVLEAQSYFAVQAFKVNRALEKSTPGTSHSRYI